MSNSQSGWIGVDLDGTLAHYDDWKGPDHIGEPVPAMLARVKEWIAEGQREGDGCMTPKEIIDLGHLANGHGHAEFNEGNCWCDPEAGVVPCEYCAIRAALNEADRLLAENAQLKAELTGLRALDKAHHELKQKVRGGFPAIKAGNAFALAYHVKQGREYAGIEPQALADWLTATGEYLHQLHDTTK